MHNRDQRSRLLLGEDAIENLKNKTVVVCGTGGVGSFAVEALARSGVGHLILIDRDTVEESNINRQLPARIDTIDRKKTDILKEHVALINPEAEVEGWHAFYDRQMNEQLKEAHPDYILDCIDSIGSKKDLIAFAFENQIPIISSMGMARRKDPTKVEITELDQTSYDPISKNLRSWKRKQTFRNKKLKVVFSSEHPVDVDPQDPLPSAIFVPATAGIAMAYQAVKDLSEKREKQNKADSKTDYKGNTDAGMHTKYTDMDKGD